jgi:hypothetical protein
MRVAEGVSAVIEGEVRRPMVVCRAAGEGRQDTDGSHPFLSTLGLGSVVGEAVGARDMQPVQLAFHPQTAFVEVDDIRGPQLVLDSVQTGLQLIGYARIGIQHQGFRVSSQKVGATLAVARLGRREACPYPKILRRYASAGVWP